MLNKVDLPGAEPERVTGEIVDLIGCDPDDVLRISAKTGEGVREVLEAIVERIPPPRGRSRRAAAGADLRLRVRPVPRRGRLPADGRRRVPQGRADRRDADRDRGRDRRDRLLRPGDAPGRRDGGRRGRLRDHRAQGRLEAAGRRHADVEGAPGGRGAAGLPRGQADGLLRPVSDRHRPLRGPARRARAAGAQRRGALLRAGDLAGARLRLSLRLPRPAAHGHRPRAARARVRPRAARDDPERPLRGRAHQRRGDRRSLAGRDARPRRDRGDPRALHPRLDDLPARATSAR